MCGRAYETYTEDELAARYHWEKAKRHPLGIKPNYNLSPTQNSPVILIRDGHLNIELLRWGLIPLWAQDVKAASKYSLINAKSEEILQKRSYKDAFKNRRCILPVSGFFEWKKDGDQKKPFAIHLADKSIMSIAGVWEHWVSKETGEIIDSFSILTTAANSIMETVHNRMPVILEAKDEMAWLDPNNHNTQQLVDLLKPCPSQWLQLYEVSTKINSPRNNSKELLEPSGTKK